MSMINGQTKFLLDAIKKYDLKSILNIGFRHDSDPTIRNVIKEKKGTFSVLEVWEPNCKDMIKFNSVDEVICADVRNISDNISKKYDAVFWLHGPEHIHWNEFLNCREKIESVALKIVVYQSPIGEDPQGSLYGNPYENHVESLVPEQFENLGYNIVLHDGSKVGDYSFLDGERTFSAIKNML